MEVLNPLGAWWALALPALLLPYLVRERPLVRRVSALFLFRDLRPARQRRFGGRPRLEPIFWLQLLAVLVALAAIVRPATVTTTSRGALVIDDSASMATADRRAAVAREARRITASGPLVWDVLALAPVPRELARGVDAGEAVAVVEALEPCACADPPATTLAALARKLAAGGYGAVHFVTDRVPTSDPAPLVVTTVGEPATNVAITALAAKARNRPSGESPPEGVQGGPDDAPSGPTVEVAGTIVAFGTEPVQATLTIEDASTGARLASEGFELTAGSPRSITLEVPATRSLRARIEPGGAIAIDDVATVEVGGAVDGPVVVVGDVVGETLREPIAKLGHGFVRMEPEEATAARLTASGATLVVFDRSAPASIVDRPALFLMPPEGEGLPGVGARVDQPEIAAATPAHPALRYLEPGALRRRGAHVVADRAGWTPLLVAEAGAVVAVRERTPRAAVVGFDLLPFRGAADPAGSILLLNLISWLTTPEDGSAATTLGETESDLRSPRPLELPTTKASAASVETVRHDLAAALALGALALVLLEGVLTLVRTGARPVLALGLRALVLVLLGLAALDPMRTEPGPVTAPTIAFDVSASIHDQTLTDAVARMVAGPTSIAFGRTAIATDAPLDARLAADPTATDLEAALAAIALETPPGGDALLVTDGWETTGDARRVLETLRRRGVHVHPVPLAQTPSANLAVEGVTLPTTSQAGEPVRVTIRLRNDGPEAAEATVRLRRGDERLAQRRVTLAPGTSALAETVLARGDGSFGLTASLVATDPTRNGDPDDDEATAWSGLRARPEILVLARGRSQNQHLVAAFEARGFRVQHGPPSMLAEGPLERWGAIVLNDLALGDLPTGLDVRLRNRVRAGGSVALVGGPRSFGLGGWRGSALEEVLPVEMAPPARAEPRTSVVLVIDKSGSMRDERRIVFAREAARRLARHLKDRDRLAVIVYDRRPRVLLPLSVVGESRDELDRRIADLRPGGGTQLFPALDAARRELLSEAAKRRHVIVLSDGINEDAATADGRHAYFDLARALAQQGITISTIALGRGADDTFLETLAGIGGGAFHRTLDPSSLPEIVVGELGDVPKEKTMIEARLEARPSTRSPLVGEIAREEPRWPRLRGLVETRAKSGARVDVETRHQGRDLPVLASWRSGRGRTVVLTTDATARWSADWVRWPQWSRLWGAIADWMLPGGEDDSATWTLARDAGDLVVEGVFWDGAPQGPVRVRVTSPAGEETALPLVELAPGRWRGRVPTPEVGRWELAPHDDDGTLVPTPLRFEIRSSELAERARSEPDERLLSEIARATGGRFDPDPSQLRGGTRSVVVEPLAPWLLGAALVAFLLELVLRRWFAATAGSARVVDRARAASPEGPAAW